MEWFLTSHLIAFPSVEKRAVGAANETKTDLGNVAESAPRLLRSTTSHRRRHTAIEAPERDPEAEKDHLGEMTGTDGICICTCLLGMGGCG